MVSPLSPSVLCTRDACFHQISWSGSPAGRGRGPTALGSGALSSPTPQRQQLGWPGLLTAACSSSADGKDRIKHESDLLDETGTQAHPSQCAAGTISSHTSRGGLVSRATEMQLMNI